MRDVQEAVWDELDRPVELPVWKRVLDLFLILLTLPVVAPLFAIIAIGIKIASRGPVFFKQERVGYRRQRFTCYKFRSMKVNADPGVHRDYLKDLMNSDRPMVKIDKKGDSRLIQFGSLLRATALDELPQLINVLKGEMSLVGPRPCTEYEFEDYAPWQMERFNTLPGLTGLWQVSGKNRTTFSQMISLDITYARHKTVAMDLAIIFKTVPTLVSQVWETKIAGRSKRQQPADIKLDVGKQTVQAMSRRDSSPHEDAELLVEVRRN